MFKSRGAVVLESVDEKLADARAQLATAEADHAATALNFAVSEDNEPALVEVEQRLAAARLLVDRFVLARNTAAAQERQRAAKARAELEKSRHRAVAQYCGAAERAAVAFREASEAQASAHRAMLSALDAVDKNLRPAERHFLYFNGVAALVADLAILELSRTGAPTDGVAAPWVLEKLPGGAEAQLRHGQHPSQATPIDQSIARRCEELRRYLAGEIDPQEDAAPELAPEPADAPEAGPLPGNVLDQAAAYFATHDLVTGEPR